MFKRLLALLALSLGLASGQTAQYPGSVVTDAQLKVAVNNINTALVGAIQAGDTTMTLLDSAGVVPNMMLAIDTLGSTPEIVCITGVSPIVMTRGCDNTSAVQHISGSGVHSYIPAWYHNASRVEIESIETQLGTNLSKLMLPLTPAVPLSSDILNCNTTSNITTQPVAFATTYTLPAFTQTAGASFIIYFKILMTTSASAPTITFSLNLDSTQVFLGNTAVAANSLNGVGTIATFDILATSVGSAGSVYAFASNLFSQSVAGILNKATLPITLNTTTTHTVSLLAQCSANTAGNQVQLVSIEPLRVY